MPGSQVAVSRRGLTIEQAKHHAATHNDALHFPTHPGHGTALVDQIYGHIVALRKSRQDDPLLYAYLCAEQLPHIAKFTIELQKWSEAVIEATPDQLVESGAQPCPYST